MLRKRLKLIDLLCTLDIKELIVLETFIADLNLGLLIKC